MALRELSGIGSNYCGTLPFLGGLGQQGNGTASAIKGLKDNSMETALAANSAFVAAGLSAQTQQP